jgi:hypothetical protein
MNTGGTHTRRHSSKVNDQVADLTIEDVRGSPSLISGALVLISIDDPGCGKVSAGLEDGEIVRVTNQLSEIVINDR